MLSGGNQQKLIVGRALSSGARVVLIDEPTQGVDVRARSDIHRVITESARAGVAFVLSSSDVDELLQVADRVVIFSRGAIVADAPTVGLDRHWVDNRIYGGGLGDD
jgi:ABC-type sugar transport system ATPase subunit